MLFVNVSYRLTHYYKSIETSTVVMALRKECLLLSISFMCPFLDIMVTSVDFLCLLAPVSK